MMRFSPAVAGAAMLLGGCTNEAADLGQSPPIALATVGREVMVPVSASSSVRTRSLLLSREIQNLGQGNLEAVRARILTASAVQADALRRTLIGLGVDPARITIYRASKTRAPAVVLTRTASVAADCRAAITLAYPDDPLPSLMSLAHCNTADDLAAMMVDPADLAAPPALGRADGAYLTDGVHAWREGQQSSLTATGTSASSPSGSSGSSAPSASTAGVGTVAPIAATPTAAPIAASTGPVATP